MPKIEDIEQLKNIIDSLGNEQKIRQERGEEIEPIAVPEQGLSSEIEDLLGLAGKEETSTAPGEESLSLDDFAIDDIAQIAGETGEGASGFEEFMSGETPSEIPLREAPLERAEAEPPAETAGIDVSAFGDFELPEVSQMTDLGGGESVPFEPPREEGAFEGGAPFGAATGEDRAEKAEETAFDLSDFGLTDEGVPVKPAEGEPEPPLPETPGSGTAFDLSGFELPDFGDFKQAPEQGEPGEGGVEPGPSPADEKPLDTAGMEEQLFDFGAEKDEVPAGEPSFDIPESTEAGAFSSFEMPDLSSIEEGFEETEPATPSGAGAVDLASLPEEEPLSEEGFDEGLDQINPDEFALPDFGKEFQIPEETPERKAAPGYPTEKIAKKEALELGELAGAAEDFQFSRSDFEAIKAALLILPLNLKLAVEELIGEKNLSGTRLKRLTDALIAGESPKTIASIVSSIIGQKIFIPKSFEKRTGVAYEREKESFAYFLKTKGLKAALIMAAVLVVGAATFFLGERFIYRPLVAMPLYDEGYAAINEGLFKKANDKFREAAGIWDSKDQYYRFAAGFIAKGNNFYAAQKYEELLSRYPGDIKGTIDYARLETLRKKFEHAEALMVDDVLMRDMNNFDAIVAAGDNYLSWAEEDFARIKDADYYFNFLIEKYPDRMAAHLRRISSLIRAERIAREQGRSDFDNENQIRAYVNFLKQSNYDSPDPWIYTELAEYLINKRELADVADILARAERTPPEYPETHYEFARYYRLQNDGQMEKIALENAIKLFENPSQQKEPARNYLLPAEQKYSLERSAKLILAYNRLGEFYAADGKPEAATDRLISAQTLFEQNPDRLLETRFANDGGFGKIYYNLGDLAFASANYGRALDLFLSAERYGYSVPDQTYKKGFVYYRRGDYDDALLEFHAANGDLPDNENILYALATTEYRRLQFSVAEGYYLYLVELLGEKMDRIPQIRVEDNPEHRDLVTNLYVAYNNLGCTYFKRSTVPNDKNSTEALAYLEKSAELYDVISRDPETMRRLEETTIAVRTGKLETVKNGEFLKAPTPFYNLDVIFHGKANSVVLGRPIDVVVYDLLPVTLESRKLLLSES